MQAQVGPDGSAVRRFDEIGPVNAVQLQQAISCAPRDVTKLAQIQGRVQVLSTVTHVPPYTLEVAASERKPGQFEWMIRRQGTLVQRSDRLHRSEADAQKDGEKAIERQFSDSQSTR
jgi:hypothetical protein